MLQESMGGFLMALADSVPGVSGGTVAFIMGFYDSFIGSIHQLVFGKIEEKKEGLRYLGKLGLGWILGMGLAVMVLSALFQSHIYTVSSLFIGFIAGSIPLILHSESESVQEYRKGIPFLIAGIALVVGITLLNGSVGQSSMDLSQFHLLTGLKLFFIGMIAISAMFLPGISGSTLLLIFGAYIPVITAVRGLLGLHLAYLPALMFFGCGVLAGAATVVKGIRICLEKFRPQAIYGILGMMVGSFYAIMQGPTTLEVPMAAMDLSHFHWIACVIGMALVVGLEIVKEDRE
ncbi:MAG: DUF368 domain-containing protein [Eubacteriales bacterium]|nr:DUF368 domain-containing protein [Eubacteriales bacterium]